jgi:hypothetical protein
MDLTNFLTSSCSIDNTVGIANGDNFEDISMIYHENAVGKSFFKFK